MHTLQSDAELALRNCIQLVPGEQLFGIVDGAQDLELAFRAKCGFRSEIRTLFAEPMASALAEVAPYLVPIDPDSGYLGYWASRLGTHAGVLVVANADANVVHTHLRDIFMAHDEDGDKYFFRFYDPRVLEKYMRQYLAQNSADAVSSFFGPIRRFVFEVTAARGLLSSQCAHGRLCITPFPFSLPLDTHSAPRS